MSTKTNDFSHAIKLFGSTPKTYEILEYLNHFLSQFDDISRYFQHYSIHQRFNIIDSFVLRNFSAKEVIFRKGEKSSFYYFILKGKIQAFNEERDGTTKLVGMISTGKSLGETGVLKDQPRSLTCIAKTEGCFLTMTSELFLSLLAAHMAETLNQKVSFIERHFPNVKKLTSVQKQRIVYAMNSYNMSKGQVISAAGSSSQVLTFVGEGELIVDLGSEQTSSHMVLKLGPGNLIGEECIFFGSVLRYNISVISEYAVIYTIHKQDVFVLLPPETINNWKSNFRAKDYSRKHLISGLSAIPTVKLRNTQTDPRFKQATGYAKKRLHIIEKLNDRSYVTEDLEKRSLLIEQKLKLFSPAAALSQTALDTRSKTSSKLNRYFSKTLLRINCQKAA